MAQLFEVHPLNPHARLLSQAVELIQRGGIAAVPTDSSYALVCRLDDKAASDNLRRIRGVGDKHHLILEASKEVPRRLSHPSRKTIGLRVPDHKTLQALLEIHGGPLLATTLIPRGETESLSDAQDIDGPLERELAAVIDAGACHKEPTTVIDLTPMADGGDPVVIRQGRGKLAALGL